MHKNPQLTLDRLERVVRERITPALYSNATPVRVSAWEVDEDGEPVPAGHALGFAPIAGRDEPAFQPFELGSTWGPAWSTTWFRIEGTIAATPGEVVELVVDLGWEPHSVGGHGEALAYAAGGTVLKAIHPLHGWLRLRGPGAADVVRSDGSFTVYLEAAANPLLLGVPPFVVTNAGEKEGASDFEPYTFRDAHVATFAPPVWELLRDLETLGGLAKELPRDRPRFWRIIDSIDHALDTFDAGDADTAEEARHCLAPALAAPAHASAHRMSAVGHAHIDSAWLWPLRETRRKVARTVSNVLDLMDSDPDFVYAMSSAQQYAWLEEDQPELFERVSEYVAQGRFIPVGGMWVEADAVMPTGESIIRQFSFGKRYFAGAFGVDPDGVWLPDSFGYSGALPQLARKAGFEWFLTQKISWNDTNKFPHHSFNWEGIDGTAIFTHFPPTDTYAASVTQAELSHGERNFRDKAQSDHSLLLFGYGDGGGGPTREMLGRAARSADLEGAPRVEITSPSHFFTRAKNEYRGKIPTWRGELYLELHRGTLTSQLAMKQGNRRTEALLRTVEYLAAYAYLAAGAQYPSRRLENIWKTLLLHQFHDILPGSSIAWVHREAKATFGHLEAELREIAAEATTALAPIGVADRSLAKLFPVAGGSWGFASARPCGHAQLEASSTEESGDGWQIENERLRARINSAGHVVSLIDLAGGRELVPAGQSLGVLTLFRDEPILWDAWDIDRHTLAHPLPLDQPVSIEANQNQGRAGVRVRYEHLGSTFTIEYSLAGGGAGLDMCAEVDWHTREYLLKVAMPLAMHTTAARFETQYGYVERVVGENTSWDEAQFEVNQHRYLHLDEAGYGVGIVNDSSYGCDVTAEGANTTVRLSLLRGARYPDPGADIGRHTMRWSVLAADQKAALNAAYELNAPALVGLPELPPLVSLKSEAGSAVIDWIKLADDGSGDLIIRIAEVLAGRAQGSLELATILTDPESREQDLLERDLTPDWGFQAAFAGTQIGRTIEFRLLPFQVATLRIHHTGIGEIGNATGG